jgi:hypothetical protein
LFFSQAHFFGCCLENDCIPHTQQLSRLHAPCAIQQQATVMVLLDASAIARNVGRDLVFAASRRAACSHSDLGCANYGAEALPA